MKKNYKLLCATLLFLFNFNAVNAGEVDWSKPIAESQRITYCLYRQQVSYEQKSDKDLVHIFVKSKDKVVVNKIITVGINHVIRYLFVEKDLQNARSLPARIFFIKIGKIPSECLRKDVVTHLPSAPGSPIEDLNGMAIRSIGSYSRYNH